MKSVLVTGGARRIGRAIVRRLAADGWRVVVHARREGDEDALKLAEEVGGLALFADLADPLGPARLFNAACAAAPDLCALVNNAAVFASCAAAESPECVRLHAVNATAPAKLMTMLGLRLMTNDENGVDLPRAGAVVNLLDTRILGSGPLDDGYSRSKRTLLAEQKKLALQFGGVMRANAVAPGPVLAPAGVHERAGEMALDHRPTPEDVADAVAFLLTAPSITGAVLPVDSGQHLFS